MFSSTITSQRKYKSLTAYFSLLSTTDFSAYLPEILLARFQDHGDKLHDSDYNCTLAVVIHISLLWTERAALRTAVKVLLCCMDIMQSNSFKEELHSFQE